MVDVDEGYFSFYIGRGDALNLSAFRDNSTLFVGVNIDNNKSRVWLRTAGARSLARVPDNRGQPDHRYDHGADCYQGDLRR